MNHKEQKGQIVPGGAAAGQGKLHAGKDVSYSRTEFPCVEMTSRCRPSSGRSCFLPCKPRNFKTPHDRSASAARLHLPWSRA